MFIDLFFKYVDRRCQNCRCRQAIPITYYSLREVISACTVCTSYFCKSETVSSCTSDSHVIKKISDFVFEVIVRVYYSVDLYEVASSSSISERVQI